MTAATRRIALAAVLLGGLLSLYAGTGAPAAGTTAFDWSMPDRYAGTDADGDGLIDSFEPDGTLEVAPDGFEVDFAGSGSACGAAATVWAIEGVQIHQGDPDVVRGNPASCRFSYRFPAEGTYEVTLEGRSAGGDRTSEATEMVRVQDFLVVSLGDSVASGEGNPDATGSRARWQDEQCHRSALAGPPVAARALEAADRRTSVTFVHLACSGATIERGLLGGYAGIVPGPTLPPQVQVLEELASQREVDAVLISIGANDVQFSSIVKDCFLLPECHRSEHPWSVVPDFEARRQQLPARYASLASRLASLDLPSDRVHLSEYFDPTRDGAGAPCPGDQPGGMEILGDHPAAIAVATIGGATAATGNLGLGSQVANSVGISRDEAEWASSVMLTSLNAEVARAAATHGWRFVGGIAAPFRTHGYCAAGGQHWVVRWQESVDRQQDENGTIHPNGPGQNLYGDRLQSRVEPGLFTGAIPRRPRQRLEVQGRIGGTFEDVVDPVQPGETVRIRARVSGRDVSGRQIAFALEGPGSLEAQTATTSPEGEAFVTYTAPEPVDVDRARVRATLVEADGTPFTDSVGLRLERIPVEVRIAPSSRRLSRGDRLDFTATVTNARDTSVTWTATGGTITPSGTYTAGQTPGQFTVTATSVADPSVSATASVTIIGYSIWGNYQGIYSGENGEETYWSGQSISQRLLQFRHHCYGDFRPFLPDGGGGFVTDGELWCQTSIGPLPFFGWNPDTGKPIPSKAEGRVGPDGLRFTLSYFDSWTNQWQVYEEFAGTRCNPSPFGTQHPDDGLVPICPGT